VENVVGKTKISLGGVYSQLLAAKARLELQSLQYQSSVNSVACGRGGYCGGHGGRQGDGGRGGFGRGAGGRGDYGSSSGTKPVCQLCKKTGHRVQRYWKRFDRNFTSEDKLGNNAEGPRYNVDTTWYSDTGATDHITSDLDKHAMRQKYTGQE
jgi:hypothetical protein